MVHRRQALRAVGERCSQETHAVVFGNKAGEMPAGQRPGHVSSGHRVTGQESISASASGGFTIFAVNSALVSSKPILMKSG